MDPAATRVISARKYEADEYGASTSWIELTCGDWTTSWIDDPAHGDAVADGFSLYNGNPLKERALCYASIETDLDELILLLTELRNKRETAKRGEGLL